jgi:hypothetical protein
MRSEIVKSSGERLTVNEVVGGFSVFFCKSDFSFYLRISSIKLRFAICTRFRRDVCKVGCILNRRLIKLYDLFGTELAMIISDFVGSTSLIIKFPKGN